jgi:hypothetical protein
MSGLTITLLNLDFFVLVCKSYRDNITFEKFTDLHTFCENHRICFETEFWTIGEKSWGLHIFGILNHSRNFIENLAVTDIQDRKTINHSSSKLNERFALKKSERQGTPTEFRESKRFLDKVSPAYVNRLLSKASFYLE